MKRKSNNSRFNEKKSRVSRKARRITRKYRGNLMYGGAPSPAPAAAAPATGNIFSSYNPSDVQTSLGNYLQAAYSINEAAKAIKSTSDFQNKIAPQNDPMRGTRYLQIDSSNSFKSAADTIQASLDSLYRVLAKSATGPLITPASAPPPLGWAPPPSAFILV